MKDVIVSISDIGADIATIDFGLILIVSTDAVGDYKQYDLSDGIANSGISDDYITTTDTYKKALAVSQQQPSPSKIGIIGCSSGTISDQDLTEKLDELLESESDFFRVLVATSSTSTKLAIAKWAEANKTFAYIQYADTTFTEDFSTTSARLLFHKTADEHMDAAEAGYSATRTPGTFNHMFKTLVGITPEKLTTTEKTGVEAKNMGYYAKVSGKPMIRGSKASNWSSGNPLYIDDLESRVYIGETMQNELMELLSNTPKLPGDINGLQLVSSIISGALQSAYDMDIIASDDNGNSDFQVNTENAVFDKKNREWKNIDFQYTYLQAAEKITVTGGVR